MANGLGREFISIWYFNKYILSNSSARCLLILVWLTGWSCAVVTFMPCLANLSLSQKGKKAEDVTFALLHLSYLDGDRFGRIYSFSLKGSAGFYAELLLVYCCCSSLRV